MSDQGQPRDTYHHGNLPETLIAEGAKLLAENGIDGFSMRQVARRAGVTVAAPSHHFGSAKGLLTVIAIEGFDKLADQMALAAAASSSPQDEVIAMCRAYVEMGKNNPGHAAIMFRLDQLNDSDPRFRKRAFHAFDLLSKALARAAPQGVEATHISYATKTLWAAMHGLVALRMIEDQEAEEIVRFAVRTLLAGTR